MIKFFLNTFMAGLAVGTISTLTFTYVWCYVSLNAAILTSCLIVLSTIGALTYNIQRLSKKHGPAPQEIS